MSVYHCGVEGPVFLDDGRVVTSDAPFQLDAISPHDKALVEEGIIVLVEDPSVEAPAPPTPSPAETPPVVESDKTPAVTAGDSQPSTADTQADAPATSSPSTPKGKGA